MRHKLKFFEQAGERAEGVSRYLDFVEREPKGESKMLITTKNGTTIREVLKACAVELEEINRMLPCSHNVNALAGIQHAINQLTEREHDRKARGVEGYHLP